MQPKMIGRYEIKSELGRGGMAIVYLGYDPRFEREVAIKVLPSELIQYPQLQLRFEREAKIIAKLDHPAIVAVYDVGEENSQPYIVMQYMRGGSLADKIKNRLQNNQLFSIEEAIEFFEQIAPGIDEAHARGVIHRDLKPSNILFDKKGAPYISDFGIAKIIQTHHESTTPGNTIIGTPSYWAPEQASGQPIDSRADIYALGVMLFEMLTGKLPYEADITMSVAMKHITEPVPNMLTVNPTLPSWMQMVMSKAMAKDRDNRFSTAVEMVNALKVFQSGGEPTLRNDQTQKKRQHNSLTITVVLLIVAMIGSGIFLQRLLNTPTPIFILAAAGDVATKTPSPSTPTETETVVPPTITATPIPSLPVIGGADKIAFLNNNNIWIMNVDGSDPQSVTNDKEKKFNLEWLPDGKTILYITGKTIKTVNIETQQRETITSFTSADYFESFHVSPNGKQAAISLARQLHVVPFDLEKFKSITNKSDLFAMNGCIFYNAAEVKDAVWSDDGKRLAIKFATLSGKHVADTIRVIDIHLCKNSKPVRLDEFPAGRFPFSDTIVNFNWDGDSLFFLNNNVRNDGFGDLGLYNTSIYSFDKLAPIENTCCYRDATFSPDGTFVIFAFQDIHLGSESPILLYYVYADSLTTNGTFEPIPLPFGSFTKRNDAPMPALRTAQK